MQRMQQRQGGSTQQRVRKRQRGRKRESVSFAVLLMTSAWIINLPLPAVGGEQIKLPVDDKTDASHLPAPWRKPLQPLQPSCLPQLLCIGAQKCGTTSLHAYLRSGYHPGLLPPKRTKETHFFDRQMNKGDKSFDRYVRMFPGVAPAPSSNDEPAYTCKGVNDAAREAGNGTVAVRLEVTPAYFFNPLVPPRVHEVLPEVRLLILLRNPVARALSNFNHKWQKEMESEVRKDKRAAVWQQRLNTTLYSETHMLTKCYTKFGKPAETAVERCLGLHDLEATDLTAALQHIELVWRSIYADQLQRWLALYPPSNFLIWVSEDFGQAPDAHLQQLVEWLGLDPSGVDPAQLQDKWSHVRSYPMEPPPEIVKSLEHFFVPHNERLFKMLKSNGYPSELVDKLKAAWGGGYRGPSVVFGETTDKPEKEAEEVSQSH